MTAFLRKCLPDVVAILLFLLIGYLYFQTPLAGGMELAGHDNDAAMGLGRDITEYRAQTGETSRWTSSIFSGMPTYQISPSYESTETLTTLSHIYELGTTGVLCYVFAYLLGFYILMRTLRFRPAIAVLGAVVWAFSSYFFIIIAAGHIWKVLTLAFVPPTIAGLVLCYRGKYLWGVAVTSLFTALQILSNHIQMSYYFGFLMLSIIVAYGIGAFVGRRKVQDAAASTTEAGAAEGCDGLLPRISFGAWWRGTAVFVLGGLLGVLANVPNLYHTYDYAKYSMRGPAELTPKPAADGQTTAKPSGSGLDYDYITQWSYGVDETLTLLIPDFKGGGSQESVLTMPATEDNERAQSVLGGVCNAFQIPADQASPITSSYWGRQPMTVGPVYVGAIVFFLFLLSLFIVRTPLKWGLVGATAISLLFAWGSDIPVVTHFLIDHLPMYNKFRTVSSALVIAELTIPLLAMMALAEIIRHRDLFSRCRANRVGLYVSLALSVGVCLLFWLAPELGGDCLTNSNQEFAAQYITPYAQQLGCTADDFCGALSSARHDILSHSALCSMLFIIFGAGLILIYILWSQMRGWMLCVGLFALCLGDMWTENKRYLNDDNFADPAVREQAMLRRPADEMILRDTDPHYRVADVNGMTNNNASYYHKTIGGYHAAKLRRYNDLMERMIYPEVGQYSDIVNYLNQQLSAANLSLGSPETVKLIEEELSSDSALHIPVLNMLNTKYFIVGQGALALRNGQANGNAWLVSRLSFVKGADAEMAALQNLDTKHAAVADESFRGVLDGTPLDSGTVQLTAYAPNRLAYRVDCAKGGLMVFSEIYYPGWTATVDGQPAELGRVNYVLRAMKVPAGSHEVVLEYQPASVKTANTVAYVAIALILIALLAAIALPLWREYKRK